MTERQQETIAQSALSRLALLAGCGVVVLMGNFMPAAGGQFFEDGQYLGGQIHPQGKLKVYLEKLEREAQMALAEAKKAGVDSELAMAEAQKARADWENAIAQVKRALAEGKLVLTEGNERAEIIEMLSRHLDRQ